MGKRKERRLAAMSNAGRRVKLDLLAEPSGDLGGSSAREDDGGDLDLKHRAGLPNSSSSGQQQENPLMLLGQYSDDEVDAQSDEKLDSAAVENSVFDTNNQVKQGPAEECIEMLVSADDGLVAQTIVKQEGEKGVVLEDAVQNLSGGDVAEAEATVTGRLCKEMESSVVVPVTGTAELQVAGDGHLGWKMVLHEESNQYYYWNTETGETSWEAPEILVAASELINEQKTCSVPPNLVEGQDNLDMHTDNVSGVVDFVSEAKELREHVPQINEWDEGLKDGTLDAQRSCSESDKKGLLDGSSAGTFLCNETSPSRNSIPSQMFEDALLLDGTGTDHYRHEKLADETHRAVADNSSYLIKHGEFLLERLKSFKRCKVHLEGQDWVFRYIVEMEVRLSDITELLSYGISMLPFWEYSQRRFKQIEAAINDGISQSDKDSKFVEITDAGERGDDKLIESLNNKNEVEENFKGVVDSSEQSFTFNAAASTAAQMDLQNVASHHNTVVVEDVSTSGYHNVPSDSAVMNYEKINSFVGLPAESVLKSPIHAAEDMDMDVDMEVEDNSTFDDTLHAKHFASAQDSGRPNIPTEPLPPAAEDGMIVPPPPDEEWIPPPPPDNELDPPPPPDNELVPPPPPDEPSKTSCPPPPSYSESEQQFSYVGPFQVPYSTPNFEFYGQTVAEVQSSNLYGHVEGQVAVPHQPVYYEPVPNTYADTDAAIVNHTDTTYYGTENGTVPPVTFVAAVGSSVIHAEPGSDNYSILPTTQAGSLNVTADVNVKSDFSALGTNISMTSADVSVTSSSATVVVAAATSLKETVPIPPSNPDKSTAAIDGAPTTAKIGSKVSRSKKRTVAVAPTLRSNKKVSKLVDKWKAAKEELHEEDEDEPENAYGILEKKRQREIEEWRAQQIASGVAKENANFQPLGGDWRERVKRRRAAREAVPGPSEVVSDGNQQPDLMALSRDLPTGWQAYWDESSKQVYYGNATTSETTWTKPTK